MKQSVTVVIKVGSASLVDAETCQPLTSIFRSIADLIADIRKNGHRVVLVSSGAVAVGRGIYKATKHSNTILPTRALSAIGQSRLTSLWEEAFSIHNQPIAQVLLQNDDQTTPETDTHTAATLEALLNAFIVPIVNENDAIATQSTSGNDVLALKVASMVKADVLAFLTDVDCLYTQNPRVDPANAKAIEVVADCDELLGVDVSSRGTDIGTGGMALKLFAARLASSMGITTVINNVKRAGNVAAIVHNLSLETERDWFQESERSSCGRDRRDGTTRDVGMRQSPLRLSTSIHTIFLPSPPASPNLTGLPHPLVFAKA